MSIYLGIFLIPKKWCSINSRKKFIFFGKWFYTVILEETLKKRKKANIWGQKKIAFFSEKHVFFSIQYPWEKFKFSKNKKKKNFSHWYEASKNQLKLYFFKCKIPLGKCWNLTFYQVHIENLIFWIFIFTTENVNFLKFKKVEKNDFCPQKEGVG